MLTAFPSLIKLALFQPISFLALALLILSPSLSGGVSEQLGGGLAAGGGQPTTAADLYLLQYCYLEIDCLSLKLLVWCLLSYPKLTSCWGCLKPLQKIQ